MSTYRYAKPFLEQAVKNAYKRSDRSLSYDELRAEADYIFVRSLHSYDSRKGLFAHYLNFMLRRNLMLAVQRGAIQRHGLRKSGEPLIQFDPDTSLQDVPDRAGLTHWTDELSDDAQEMIQFCLRKQSQGISRSSIIRASLKRYYKAVGWSIARIRETFNEIGEALQ